MAMSKKHYEAFAKMFRECAEEYEPGTPYRVLIETLAEETAGIMSSDGNRLFDRSRFLRACEPKD